MIAPWREWDFKSREALLDFAEKHQIPIAKDKRGEAPFSVDANLLHSSSEGKVLEDPAVEAPEFVHQRTIAPEDAPDKPTVFTMDFERGDPVAIDGEQLSPAALLTKLNELGHDNGVGRLDLVENRFVGMKSRGVYETPGGTILLAAHRGIECITLDRGAMHLKDELMPRYAELIYNGFWFAPEREMLQAADRPVARSMVTGQVRVKLYKGNVTVIGRDQPLLALRPGPGHLRGGQGRLRPPRRGRLHQAQRAAPARGGQARPAAARASNAAGAFKVRLRAPRCLGATQGVSAPGSQAHDRLVRIHPARRSGPGTRRTAAASRISTARSPARPTTRSCRSAAIRCSSIRSARRTA